MDMYNSEPNIKRSLGTIYILIIFLLIAITVPDIEAKQKTSGKSVPKTEFDRTVKGGLITLKARDASLKEILEEIGRIMEIDVIATIPVDEKITLEFDMLSFEDALKRFKTNYAFVTDLGKDKGKITKVLVVPAGKVSTQYPSPAALSEVKASRNPEKDEGSISKENQDQMTSKPEPFKFEFDPSQFMKDKKQLKE